MADRGHILLVDDDEAMAVMYRLGLEGEGFRVTVLPDAMSLNDAVEEQRPDVLVLDWELPGILGDEALDRLRGTKSGSGLKVFMLSNFAGTANRSIDRVFAAGAIAWLEKINTTPTNLAARLREALEKG